MAKKIGAIVSLSIIGILLILTIVLANVQVNNRINCEKPQHVYVYTDGYARGAEAEKAAKIVKYINNASKDSWLTAFFAGELNDGAKVVEEKKTLSISSDKTYVSYVYSTEQTLKEGSKTYKDSDGNSYKYEELMFEVDNEEGKNTVKVYVIPNSQTNTKYTHYYNLEANFDELYSYIQNNF